MPVDRQTNTQPRLRPSFGLFLNTGGNLGPTPEAVFDLTRRQAELADATGYDQLWLTEHHFIRFGISPSSLTAAAFMLGATQRMRVGTAVVLSPLCNPIELAERAALLDQLSGGRFDLGIGRGGYVRDYDVLGIDTARWDDEPEATARTLLDLWLGRDGLAAELQPPARTAPHPPLLMATSSEKGVAFAAEHGVPLQHYFATPVASRLAVEAMYAERARTAGSDAAPAHVHSLIVLVTDSSLPDDVARERLAAALTESFRAGDHPKVPQAPDRHVGPDGRRLEPAQMVDYVVQGAIIGPPGQVVDELGAFIDASGARRLALYQEAIADPALILASIERFASDVAPQLTGTGASAGSSVN